jgi:hypothetical protein
MIADDVMVRDRTFHNSGGNTAFLPGTAIFPLAHGN